MSNMTDKVCTNGRGTCSGPDKCDCSLQSDGKFCEICKEGLTGDQCTQPIVDTSNARMAIGITIGVSAFIVIVILLSLLPFIVVYYRKQRKQRAQEIELRNLLSERLIAINNDDDLRVNEEWIIHRDDIQFESRISEGAFGVVFKGKYRNKMPVAIKKLKLDDSLEEFESEVRILKSLRHPVRFVSRK